ncbi:MAG: cupin domain-containing protein [Pirellulaceae bacterium]|nr:cupin domain-containing protein [Pirellulaceae bacterium]
MTSPRVAAGQGATYRLLGGDIVTLKVVGADMNGAYTLLETITPPGAGPPPHRHHREDETFYILAGQFEFHVGEQTIAAGPGDLLTAPLGTPHFFRNVGPSEGKLLILCRPAGFEHFVADFSQVPPDKPPDIAQLVAIGQKHGIEFVLG